jgi:preprotein translocase subunit Sec61beta
MMVIQVEVGVVKLYDESPDEMVVISPLIVVVLSVMVVVVKELSMMVVVHASNDSPETVV